MCFLFVLAHDATARNVRQLAAINDLAGTQSPFDWKTINLTAKRASPIYLPLSHQKVRNQHPAGL